MDDYSLIQIYINKNAFMALRIGKLEPNSLQTSTVWFQKC